MSQKKSKSRRKPANINQVRERIRKLAKQHKYDAQVLLEFAEFVHGGKFKELEPTINDLKAEVLQVFNCSSLPELKKIRHFS